MRTCHRIALLLLAIPFLSLSAEYAAAEEGDYTQSLELDLDGDRVPDAVTFTRYASKPWHQLSIRLSSEGKRVREYSGLLLPNYLLRRTCESGDTRISRIRGARRSFEVYTSIGDMDRGTCGTLHEQRLQIAYRNSEVKIVGVEERFAAPKGGDPGFDSRKKAVLNAKCPPPTLDHVEEHGLPACLKLGLFEQP